ncbi:efflux transporter outer membrane subunit [Comamonas badia]|uniref:efflux transporter outer membrane subunit n=1 Tax=Comamonas badia TaxID=265291 RepID=UPI0004A37EAA|nr:efflux transporter outer membrane subunit [Comamonas badia]
MNRPLLSAAALAASLFLVGCASLAPELPQAAPETPAQWPLPPTTGATTYLSTAQTAPADTDASTVAAADIGWRDFFADARLQELIARALHNNRDLRTAVLNVEKARAQYGIQRADRLPSLGAGAQAVRSGGDAPQVPQIYTANLNAQFELDLFGRVRSLTDAALARYLATDEARRATQLSLVAQVAQVYLALGTDQALQGIAQATYENQQASYKLTEQRKRLGAVSALDLSQARTLLETARTDAARFAGQVAQDINALTLLVGQPVEAALLPAKRLDPQASGLQALPAGLPSEVLLLRPDILQAEQQLRAANANIGAARAAFFPSISLTASAGTSSTELSGLFNNGSFGWSFIPSINIPIFQGGRLQAGLDSSIADRDIMLAQYEKSIQSGFREVADALALSHTLAEQGRAQKALLDAASQAHALSEARYKAGQDSYLTLLDAQRTLYAAQQSLAATELQTQSNRVTLYKVLGGGWLEQTAQR